MFRETDFHRRFFPDISEMQMYDNNINIMPMLSVLYKRTQAIAIFAYAFVLKISVIGSDG